MARKPGSANLAASLEVLAGAPLDAREVAQEKADLTASGSFPYKYIGMEVYVVAEDKKYRLIGADPTDIENWEEVGGGSAIQVEELPEASEDLEGTIYQYIGATDVNYTNGYFYQCVSDGEDPATYSWVQKDVQDGGSGSGSLGENITASVTVGGITSGTTYTQGTSYDVLWKNLINPVAYPTLTNPSATLAATGAKLLETGSTLSTTMTVTFSRGSITPAYGTNGYRSGVATDYALNGGTAQAGNTFNVTVDASQLTYQATVNHEAGEQPKDSEGNNYNSPLPAGSVNSNTITYEFVDAIWANTSNITTVAKLALVSKTAKVKRFDFPAQTVSNPEIFDMPASWTITGLEVLNTLSGQWEDCSSEFTITNTTHDDAAGNTVNYKRYTDNRGYNAGARAVRVKWS